MKKISFIIGLAMLLAWTSSCKKNENKETSSFSASIESDEGGSRTYLDGYKVRWSAGNQIVVYGNGDHQTYTLTAGAGTQVGTFTTTGGVKETDTYRGFYPATSCTGLSGNVFSFSMPSSQTYTAGGFADDLNPMGAKSVGGGETVLPFKNAFAVLKLQTTGNRSVTRVELTVPSGNYVYGNYTFDPTTGTTNYVSGGGQTITLNCPTAVALNASTTQDFYIVLPPGSINNGFTVNYFKDSSATPFYTQTVESTATNISLARNTIKRMNVTANASTPQVQNLLPVMISSAWQVTYKSGDNTITVSTSNINNTQGGHENYGISFNHGNSTEYYVRPTAPSTVSYVKGHTYYVRFWAKVGNFAGSSNVEFFWPEDGACRFIPPVGSSVHDTDIGSDNTWVRFSRKWTNFSAYPTNGSYSPRIDFNKANGGRVCYVSGAMLIDLTAAGLESLSESQLNAKRYIFGDPIDSDTW